MSRLFALCLLALVPPGGDSALARDDADAGVFESGEALSVEARYSSSVLIFKVGEITLSAHRESDSYFASTEIGAAGLAALFTDFDIRAEVSGGFEAGLPVPNRYAHIERTGRKVRAVDVAFVDRLAVSTAEPPFGSLGQPPASDSERTGVLDPMTAVFFLSDAINASGNPACSGSIPVFDGKQRYDLRLEAAGVERVRTPGWRGEARVCHIWYEPISGYDPEDFPSENELSHPLTVWLAPLFDGEAHIPVRLHTRAGFGGITIEAQEIRALPG